MRVGIIGSGYIGGTVAKLLVGAGHEVMISNSRGPHTLREMVDSLGERAHAGTPEEAVRFGEVILVAIPFGRYESLPAADMQGKIVIDAMNYYPQRDGNYAELDENRTTSSEMLVKFLGGARVVKAFNTIWFEHLRSQGRKDLPVERRRAIFVAGDDADAKGVVARLIEEIGFGAVDTGSLGKSARQQPGAPVYNRDMTVAEARAEAGS